MKKFFPYDPSNPVAVEGEEHKIIHGQIRLDHVPLDKSIEVRGFRAANSAANLQSNEFFCNYRADTLYREANRLVYFWSGRSGQTVYVSYQAVASPITADDMNEVSEFLVDADNKFIAQNSATNELRNNLVAAREEARLALTAHNVNVDAHGDIRNLIRDEADARRNADSSLQNQLTILRNAFDILSAAFNELSDDVDDMAATVTTLRTQLADEISARQVVERKLNAEIDARTQLEESLNERISFNVDTQTFNEYVFDEQFGDVAAVFDNDDPSDNPDDEDDIAYVFDDESSAGELTDDEINEIFSD